MIYGVFAIGVGMGFFWNRWIKKVFEHESIGRQWLPIVHGIGMMWIYAQYGKTFESVMFLIWFSICITLSVIDIQWYIIPNQLLTMLFIVSVLYKGILGTPWLQSSFDFFALSIPLFLLHLVSGGKLGMGDIKLMAVAGLFLGWKKATVALLFGSVLASGIGLFCMGLGIWHRGKKMPFGPFLSMGIFIAALYGEAIIQWYLIG